MYNCKKCDFSTENNSLLANHYKYVHSSIDKKELLCDKCDKIFKNIGSLKIHKKTCGIEQEKINHICPKCNSYISNSIEKHINYCDGNGTRRQKEAIRKTEIKTSWNKGLTKETSDSLKKISESLKKRYNNPDNIQKHTEETKKKLSKIMLDRYKNGWENKAGRCKKIEYDSKIAGIVKLDGGWELATAKYLDSIGVQWIRNKKRFKYWNSIKESESTYCPDFFIKDWNKYIEVKGYKTELDEIKWKQFKEELEIWDKEKLKSLGIKTKWL